MQLLEENMSCEKCDALHPPPVPKKRIWLLFRSADENSLDEYLEQVSLWGSVTINEHYTRIRIRKKMSSLLMCIDVVGGDDDFYIELFSREASSWPDIRIRTKVQEG